jgi:hypothetical protein
MTMCNPFTCFFFSDVSNDGEKSMAMVESYLEDLSDNSSAETPEDEAYRVQSNLPMRSPLLCSHLH